MAFSLTSPVTGATMTGLTSPTYTLVADQPPNFNSKQWYVSALGGTQTGVEAHSMSQPFTIAVFKPAVTKTIGVANPSTGVIPNIPRNVTKVVVRKGVYPAANQASNNQVLTLSCDNPAGADVYDSESLKAALSLMIGALDQQSAGLGDSLITGSI